jgi:hypothetical protein
MKYPFRLSQQDQLIWDHYKQDVKPILHDKVPSASHFPVKVRPVRNVNHTWDLHGMTLMDAHATVNREIDESRNSFKYMTFITGKSGQMQKEFPDWLRHHPHVHRCEPLNDGGAFRIWFKKTRHKHK